MRTHFTFILMAALIIGALVVSRSLYQECEAESARIDQKEIVKMAEEILAGRHCPCQCGRYLPGSSLLPAPCLFWLQCWQGRDHVRLRES